jgi:hypothetical protein
VEAEGFPRAEETLRLLAAAAGAARLYPPASALPREAVARFVTRANEIVASGPVRFVVDPHGVRIGDMELAAGQSQVVALAESLHAMQVGQLVIAPGVSEVETERFVALANTEPGEVRRTGGARALLGAAGVQHIAVIEVSLRASDETGLLGLDLTTEPLDDIAIEVVAAVERRARELAGGTQTDEMAEAIERLEEATRELAMERVAAALMRLDDRTRTRILGLSLTADANGSRMDGMLTVIARMQPAALARLLKLVATQAQTDPQRIAAAMTLPPETLKALTLMLAPAPDIAPVFGVPDSEQARLLAQEVAFDDDPTEIRRQVAIASPKRSSGRALATATALSRNRVDAETVQAIGDVLPQAARDGAFSTVREALRRLDEIAAGTHLAHEVECARSTLSDPTVLRDVCRAVISDADAAIAGEIVHAAGPSGAEALLDSYVRMVEPQRSLMRPVLRSSSDMVLGVARTKLRATSSGMAIGILRALTALGDRRAVAVIAETLENSLDERVRFAAATSLANMGTKESVQALIRVLGHREVETQRHVVRELGRIKAASAVPALARTFDDVKVLTRSYEVRREIIATLTAIGTPEAEKALRRFSTRIPVFGRKSRELKRLATEAVTQLSQDRGVDAP